MTYIWQACQLNNNLCSSLVRREPCINKRQTNQISIVTNQNLTDQCESSEGTFIWYTEHCSGINISAQRKHCRDKYYLYRLIMVNCLWLELCRNKHFLYAYRNIGKLRIFFVVGQWLLWHHEFITGTERGQTPKFRAKAKIPNGLQKMHRMDCVENPEQRSQVGHKFPLQDVE